MKKINTLDKILISVAVFDIIFVISMVVTFWMFQDVPDVLITIVLGCTFGECGLCTHIWKKKLEKKGEIKDDSIYIDKSYPSGSDCFGSYDHNYIPRSDTETEDRRTEMEEASGDD